MAAPVVHTYHCICTSLLLATTHSLSSLPRRASPSLDGAIILPLPATPPLGDPKLRHADDPDTASESEPERDLPGGQNRNAADSTSASHIRTARTDELPPLPETGYTALLSTVVVAKPTIIRRSDGFEKRYLLRCGRCRLVVGYELDDAHFVDADGGATRYSGRGGDLGWGSTEGDAGGLMDVDAPQGVKQGSRRTKLVYLLPAGIMSTEEMVAGKKLSEVDVGLGDQDGRTAVAAWETA